MILSRYTLKNIHSGLVSLPDESLFELPEKVLQFGTDVFLRGVPDYLIDKANRKGIFNGRIVAVVPSQDEDVAPLHKQDGLYTLCVRSSDETIHENSIVASISRILTASEQWNEVLECAHNPELQIIISNTTELGIRLVPEDIRLYPPRSFPGKLLSFLYERFRAFGGSAHSGMVIIPTELISDNGKQLEAIVLELAHLNSLDDKFIEWLENHNCFCNSVVDRIVHRHSSALPTVLESELGYADQLVIMSEDYCVWAIEADTGVAQILSFAEADNCIRIEPDIKQYRELKLRLLNGTHTFASGVAFLSGFETVYDAMFDNQFSSFIVDLMQNEIAPSVPAVDELTAGMFGSRVLERSRNPHIRQNWQSITMNYSAKVKMRCIPVLMKHYEQSDVVPQAMALGFAAYIFYMKAVVKNGESYYGQYNGQTYLIQDERAGIFYKRWAGSSIASLVQVTLSDAFWSADLVSLPGFNQAVIENLNFILQQGMRDAVARIPSKKIITA